MVMLEFYDVKAKKRFKTSKFTKKKTKNGRMMAVAVSPLTGNKATRFLPSK